MTNNTINVPRELLENIVLCYNEGEFELGTLAAECHALLSAPSPAGVDGWDVAGDILEKLSAAQAIIDGLLGDVAAQEETANQWRELALQFDRHRMTAMAHIRAAASGDKSAIEALGVFAALPPIPGHEITAEFDQQAKRIAELGLLLQTAEHVLCEANFVSTGEVVETTQADRDEVREKIIATLTAGKEGE